MEAYYITYQRTIGGEVCGAKYMSEKTDSRDVEVEVMERMPYYLNVRASRYAYYFHNKCAELVKKVKVSDNAYEPAAIRERLRCCNDLAYILGPDSQESLYRTLDRIVTCDYTLTHMDSCPFSFGFYSPGMNIYGGVIYHSAGKEWSLHT